MAPTTPTGSLVTTSRFVVPEDFIDPEVPLPVELLDVLGRPPQSLSQGTVELARLGGRNRAAHFRHQLLAELLALILEGLGELFEALLAQRLIGRPVRIVEGPAGRGDGLLHVPLGRVGACAYRPPRSLGLRCRTVVPSMVSTSLPSISIRDSKFRFGRWLTVVSLVAVDQPLSWYPRCSCNSMIGVGGRMASMRVGSCLDCGVQPPRASSSASEQHASPGRPAPATQHRDLCVSNLTVATLAAQLHHRLVEEAIAVRPAAGELTAVRVQRQVAVESDALAVTEEVLGLAHLAETEGLEPRQAVEGESVIELGDVDVSRAE